MQTFPDSPKSYSLIKNLLPSVSLFGETSQPDQNQNDQTKVHLRQEISNQVNDIINVIQTSTVNELKQILRQEIHELEMLSMIGYEHNFGTFSNKSYCEDMVLSKLRQLAIISQILVQRMNEKYTESKSLYEQLRKKLSHENRSINGKMNSYFREIGKRQKKLELSQQTEKKGHLCNEEKEKQDLKKTRKQNQIPNHPLYQN